MSVSSFPIDEISFSTPSVASSYSGSTTKSPSKVSRALVTVFHDSAEAGPINPASYFGSDWQAKLQVWVAQWECCPSTGTTHAHIYLELRHSHRLRVPAFLDLIAKISPRNNVKFPRRANKNQRQGAVNYCQKESTRIAEAPDFKWSDGIDISYSESFALAASDKKKTRHDKQVEHIMSRPVEWSWAKLLHENDESRKLLAACSWGRKFHELRKPTERTLRTIENVIICYGSGGSGKTTYAQSYDSIPEESRSDRYYRRNYDDKLFWGGGQTAYNNQRVIHLDEFTGQETLSRFNELCDVGNTGGPVNVKGGGTSLNHSSIIITSNLHPAYWFHNVWTKDDNLWVPFHRRITKVLFFPALRQDGTRNLAGPNSEPFVVDQTDEWRTCVEYVNACEHARKYWPRTHDSDTTSGTWTYSNSEGVWLKDGKIPSASESVGDHLRTKHCR